MRRFWLVVGWWLVVGGGWFFPEQAAGKDYQGLRRVVKLMNEADAAFFNQKLRPADVVFTYGLKPRLLGKIKGPKRMFSRGSVQAIKAELKKVGKKVSFDYINYNPEHWKAERTPKAEQEHLVEAVKEVRKLANKYGTGLSFATDHVLLYKYGREIAPLVDMFGVQLQRFQTEPVEVLRQKAAEMAKIVKTGDRDVPVFFQLSLAPPRWKVVNTRKGKRRVLMRKADGSKLLVGLKAEEVLRQIEAVQDLADGIALIYSEESRGELRKLLALLRD